MVAQVLPYAGQIAHHRDAVAAEVISRTYPRKHEQLRGRDGPSAENNLVAFDGENIAAAFDHRPDGPVAFKQYAVNGAVGPNREIQAVPGRVQIP